MPAVLYTIGHSNRSPGGFISLLELHHVTVLADVRSVPFSRRHPQFNRGPLGEGLRFHGIDYLFLGDKLGARPDDPSCSAGGKAVHRKIAATAPFRNGLERVRVGMRNCRVLCLMCAEKDPLNCHRAILICRQLRGEGADIRHIIDHGTTETQAELEMRLVARLKLEPDLFRDAGPDGLIERAYDMQSERIASAGKGRPDGA